VKRPRLLGTAVALLLLVLAGLQWWPLPARLHAVPWSRVLEDHTGALLTATIAADEQWRLPPSSTVPERYRDALLAFEDKRFFHHPGVDPLAIARAAVSNMRAGRVVSGGSTLTMQLARMLRDDPPRTLGNKLLEALLAVQLEWHFSKQELLQLYAAHAPFGGNVVGLRAATWRYFGRPAERLTWAEAALLAVLPNNPALIHPGRSRDALRARRDALLARLHSNGLLSSTDLKLARREALPGAPTALPGQARHLLFALAAREPERAVFRSTLDGAIQRQAEAVAARHMRALGAEGIHNLAAIVLDNRTMAVRAYLGNVTDRETAAAVDIVQRPRSTGSLLKPFLFGLMVQSGQILPATLVPDLPLIYSGYQPENHDYQWRGAVPAEQALVQSLNAPAVAMLYRYGQPRFYQALESLGMTTLFRPAEEYGLPLVLGGAEGTLLELAGAYANLLAIARDGDRRGQQAVRLLVAEDSRTGRSAVIRQASAWLTLQALVNVRRPGNERLWQDFGGQALAWKTGTSYGLRDGWAIGSNGAYTIGVWVGNAEGTGVAGLGGTASAAPLMFDLFGLVPRVPLPPAPMQQMKLVSACVEDGFLAGDLCPAEPTLVPADSHFQTLTPHYQRVHLDPETGLRVHGDCHPVNSMSVAQWFVLPPAQAHYWRQFHPGYRRLPDWRPDCLGTGEAGVRQSVMTLLYPDGKGALFLPRDLDGSVGQLAGQLLHRRADARVHWHLDDRYLGETRLYHEMAFSASPGRHRLVLVDDQGARLEREIRVLGAAGTH
jgi:penicillin-binding protein 1C